MDSVETVLAAFAAGAGSDARRLFHGRGHCFPGLAHLNIDLLPPLVLITLYAEETAENVQQLTQLCRAIPGIEAVMVQYRYLPRAPSELMWGETPPSHVVEEAGLRYQVRVGTNQNTGFFLDMAAGRRWVQGHARGARVLNLFSYTCAFSVAAVAGGADQVINLDMSNSALSQGRENHRLNGHDLNQVRFLGHELFRSWGKLRKAGPYDLVIVDPPSFQRGSFEARKDYPRLMGRLPQLLSPKGRLLLCLNDPGHDCEFLLQAMAERAPELVFKERIANPSSFPEADPERALKVLLFESSAS